MKKLSRHFAALFLMLASLVLNTCTGETQEDNPEKSTLQFNETQIDPDNNLQNNGPNGSASISGAEVTQDSVPPSPLKVPSPPSTEGQAGSIAGTDSRAKARCRLYDPA